MREPDAIRLRHMLDAARRAYVLTSGRERSDLDTDDTLALALARLLEIIGEAANTVSAEYRAGHPEIPWRQMVGMRNRLIHAYFNVELNIVWDTVTLRLPTLITQLEELLVEAGDDADHQTGAT